MSKIKLNIFKPTHLFIIGVLSILLFGFLMDQIINSLIAIVFFISLEIIWISIDYLNTQHYKNTKGKKDE